MNPRGMTVAVALLLAMTATLAVFLYVKGVRDEARVTDDLVDVVVSDQDIPAGTDLDALIADGAFTTTSVPEDAVIDGAVTELSQLDGQETSAAVLAGEQIPEARLQGVGELPGGTLGIPDGYEAVSVALAIPRAVAGEIGGGDHVTIFASFDKSVAGRETTIALVPDVLVLDVIGISSDSNLGRAASAEGIVTLALKPGDAEDLVFAQEHGSVYMGLLPPGQKGAKGGITTFDQVAR